jgi:AcrR family transcriptional regulator
MAVGLRERKKLRTRQTIVRVAFDLFTNDGYQATTLVQVAEAAEIAPSTLHTYFRSKSDIVFSVVDDVIESARRRLMDRRPGETASEAVIAWVTNDLLEVEEPYEEPLRRLPAIVQSEPELVAEERLRRALLEDVFAEAYALDLDEPAEHLRARVMATIAMRAMIEVWETWHLQHADDAELDLVGMIEVKTAYLERALEAGAAAIETLPSPD